MGSLASQITSLMIVYSTAYSDTDQRKHQSSASLAFVRWIHRRPVNSPHKWPVTRKMFPFYDIIMQHDDGFPGICGKCWAKYYKMIHCCRVNCASLISNIAIFFHTTRELHLSQLFFCDWCQAISSKFKCQRRVFLFEVKVSLMFFRSYPDASYFDLHCVKIPRHISYSVSFITYADRWIFLQVTVLPT